MLCSALLSVSTRYAYVCLICFSLFTIVLRTDISYTLLIFMFSLGVVLCSPVQGIKKYNYAPLSIRLTRYWNPISALNFLNNGANFITKQFSNSIQLKRDHHTHIPCKRFDDKTTVFLSILRWCCCCWPGYQNVSTIQTGEISLSWIIRLFGV